MVTSSCLSVGQEQEVRVMGDPGEPALPGHQQARRHGGQHTQNTTIKIMSEMVDIPRPQVQPWHGWRGLSQHKNKLAIVGGSRKISSESLWIFSLLFRYLMCNCFADLVVFSQVTKIV